MDSPSRVSFAEASHRIFELHPQVAAFDCDGTLWSIDSGLGFLDFELERQLIEPTTAATARARLRAYHGGQIDEDTFNGYLAALHAGLRVSDIEAAAREYVRQQLPPVMFHQMTELLEQLLRTGCQVWLVSSTNQWVIEAAASLIGVPAQRVLATAAVVIEGVATDRLIRVPNDSGKRLALEAVLTRPPDLAFGNSRWDAQMLDFARQAFAVHPTPELTGIAAAHGWPVLLPT